VRATVDSARQRFGRRRLVFLFQPNTFSRNQYLFEEWKTTFTDVDLLVLAPTFGMGRETPEHGLTSDALADVIVGPRIDVCATFEEAVERAASALLPGDVFFTVGSGDIDRAGPLILEKLRGAA
jgi:UDP-N-acetylmuramate--alanine ligase